MGTSQPVFCRLQGECCAGMAGRCKCSVERPFGSAYSALTCWLCSAGNPNNITMYVVPALAGLQSCCSVQKRHTQSLHGVASTAGKPMHAMDTCQHQPSVVEPTLATLATLVPPCLAGAGMCPLHAWVCPRYWPPHRSFVSDNSATG